jgi:hypothetical protein
MFSIQNKNHEYFLDTTKNFYEKNFKNRVNFLRNKNNFFKEISKKIRDVVSNSKSIIFFCCGNVPIQEHVISEKKIIQEVNKNFLDEFYKNQITNIELSNEEWFKLDHVVIADIEHQKNPLENLKSISKKINDDARIIVVSKNLIWSIIIKAFKILFGSKFPNKYNFLPLNYLNNLFEIADLEILRTEKVIIFPFYIPLLSNLLNKFFRLPILNFFCMLNITVLKKAKVSKKDLDNNIISVIIPCKDEEQNIKIIENNIISLGKETEFIFGDDKSKDNTKEEIKKINLNNPNIKISTYQGPGICKSKNVFEGITRAKGDIVLIFDADCTVKFQDIKIALEILTSTNADMINCTRMIYPQEKNAMKTSNFYGNIFFAYMFSILFKKKITDTLCGTKIFYKKDWVKINKTINFSGIEDLWGDFDLLIGAYKNNLKILEVPVQYFERVEGKTKMTSVISNAIRMLSIVIKSYYYLRIK